MEKRKAFGDLFASLRQMFQVACLNGSHAEMTSAYAAEANALHGLMPFLPTSEHPWMSEKANEIESAINQIWVDSGRTPSATRTGLYGTFTTKQADFRHELFQKLFPA